MGQRVFQPSFAGGIIGPDMYARTDTTKYAVGVSRADNVFVRLQGGLANRPGFTLAGGFDTSSGASAQWLLPIQITTSLSYHLEFTDGVFRVLSEGSYILDSAVPTTDLDEITSAAEARLVFGSPGDAARFSVGDLIYINDPAGTHTLDQQVVRVAQTLGAEIVFEVYDGTRVDTSAGTGVWGEVGAGATVSKVYAEEHSYDLEDVPFIRFTQDNTDLYLAHPEYPPQRLRIVAPDEWELTELDFEPETQPPAAVPAISISGALPTNPVRIGTAAPHGLTTGSTVLITGVTGMTELNDNFYTVNVVSATNLDLASVSGEDIDGTGFTAYAGSGTMQTFAAIEETVQSGTVYRYRVASIDAESLEESLPSETLTIDSDLGLTDITVIWPRVPGASIYNVYKEGSAGFALVGATANTSFVDNNITADATLTPVQSRNPFSDGNNPAVVSFVEQRLAFANTVDDPQIVEMSQSGTFQNFTRGFPQEATDALTFRLRTDKLNTVRAIVAGQAMLMFTAAAEWLVSGSDNEGILTPTSIVPRPISYWGSFDIAPVTAGEHVFFSEPNGNVVRDFRLAPVADVAENSRDLTVLVRHLFEGREITSWCYTQSPDRLLWVTLDNGQLLSLCYMAEHDVWGWTTHTLGGTGAVVYQVSAAREGARDVLYAVIGRDLENGHTVMTERLAPRVDDDVEDAFFVDSGLSYSGTPASALSGLFHLRGQQVVALLDGDVFEEFTVDEAGVVDFGGTSGEVAHVGLGYSAIVETLDVDFETDELGAMQGRYKAASEVAVNVKRTRGVRIGTTEDRMEELIEWEASMVGGPIPLFTGTRNVTTDSDWVRNARIVVEQPYPLPMTLLGIAPEWTLGE